MESSDEAAAGSAAAVAADPAVADAAVADATAAAEAVTSSVGVAGEDADRAAAVAEGRSRKGDKKVGVEPSWAVVGPEFWWW